MGEGKSHGGNDQGNTDQKESQSHNSPTSAAPSVDIEPIEPPRVTYPAGGSDSEQYPQISKAHASECEDAGNDRPRKLRQLLTPEWVSAGSTFAAVVVAVAAIYVSWAGTQVSLAQLEEMRASSAQADQMAGAAIRQAAAIDELKRLADQQIVILSGLREVLKKQEETSIIQLRANVVSDGLVSKARTERNNLIKAFRFNAVLLNIGNTDAIEFSVVWRIDPLPRIDGMPFGCPGPVSIPREARKIVLPPGKSQMQRAIDIPIGEIARASSGEIDIYSRGRIEYRDVFPGTPPHFYEWCVRIVPNDIERGVFSYFNEYHNRDY